MDTFVFRSLQSEVRITVIAADSDRARQELDQCLVRLEEMGIMITTSDFVLISTY